MLCLVLMTLLVVYVQYVLLVPLVCLYDIYDSLFYVSIMFIIYRVNSFPTRYCMYISCQLLAVSQRYSDISNIFYISPFYR